MKHPDFSDPTSGWLESRYHRRGWQEALKKPAAYPADRFQGRGLVFCVGGEQLFVNLWVNLCLLRRVLKCSLPIEIWHFGDEELNPHMRALLEPFGVKIVDGDAYAVDLPQGKWRGFALKTLAVIRSTFQEVLFLDADNYPVRDPSFLFDEWPYQWTGACFWPDVWDVNSRSAIWSNLDLPFVGEKEWESGQMVIDKRRSWRALDFLQHLTFRFPFYYQHVYGDKMLFYAAWKKLDQPYAMPKRAAKLAAAPDRRILVNQFDFVGKLLFQHRATADWTLSMQGNADGPSAVYDEVSREFLEELRQNWLEAHRKCSPNSKGKRAAYSLWERLKSIRSAPVALENLDPVPPSTDLDKWDAMARQALLSTHLASARLMGIGIEALQSATEVEARSIFRFFAALIYIDPRLAMMLPKNLKTEGTALNESWKSLESLAALAVTREDKTGLLSVGGNLFMTEPSSRLSEEEKTRLKCLNAILVGSESIVWNRWIEFWRKTLNDFEPSETMTSEQLRTNLNSQSELKAWQAPPPAGKVLILTPLKNAADLVKGYCERLSRLNYPPQLLSLGLLESDSRDDTYAAFDRALPILRTKWNRVDLWKHDYNYNIPQGYSRWEPALQLARRQILAQSRNELLRRSLKDEDWVLWLDADVIDYPRDIIEQLLSYGKEILHPHCVIDYGGQTFDRNAWRDQGRIYMESLRAQELLTPLDAVGGTLLFIRADLHRRGLIFPEMPYGRDNPRIRTSGTCYDPENPGELETEGLGIMASDMGIQCWGLPDLEILHRNR